MVATHWYHPHRHGSTSVQVSSCPAVFFIVDDDDDHHHKDVSGNVVPEPVRHGEEVLFILHPLNILRDTDLPRDVGDALFQAPTTDVVGPMFVVNGVVRPTVQDVVPMQ